MKLLFELRPVDHLDATVDYYRSLGLELLGWPDDDTAVLGPRDGAPTIVLVRDPAESALGAGGVYDVGDVATFFSGHPGLDWLMAPVRTPLGWYAVFADRTGTCIRLLDPFIRPENAGRPSADLSAVAG